MADALGKKPREMVRPFYVAITGSPTALPLFESMELLGRDLCRERVREALTTLGGSTSREQDAWREQRNGVSAGAPV